MVEDREEIWRPEKTAKKAGYTNRQLRNLEAKGKFPKRFSLSPGGRAKGHLKSEVLAWMRERAASREPEKVNCVTRHQSKEAAQPSG